MLCYTIIADGAQGLLVQRDVDPAEVGAWLAGRDAASRAQARGRTYRSVCVCDEKENTPPEKKTGGNVSFQNTKSGAGEQRLQDSGHAAGLQGRGWHNRNVFFTDTSIHIHIMHAHACMLAQSHANTSAVSLSPLSACSAWPELPKAVQQVCPRFAIIQPLKIRY